MKLYAKGKNYTLYNGNSLDMLEVLEPNSIDSIVCDPPYEIGFMNKSWDKSGVAYNVEIWKKCFEVLKPGGHLLAFGGSRTYHRIACAIEDAGFEIRDCVMWLYGSGFPRGINIGLAIDKELGINNETGLIKKGVGSNNTFSMKSGLGGSQEFKKEYKERIAKNKWGGYGTTLKPSYEPIIMARKPVEKTIVDNVLKYGCGGINIDECRVLVENTKDFATNSLDKQQKDYKPLEKCNLEDDNFRSSENDKNPLGRFPANVIIDGSEEVLSGFPYTKSSDMSLKEATPFTYNKDAFSYGHKTRFYNRTYNDSGSAGRYFYCAKASKKDRNEGLDVFKDALTSQDDNNTLEEGVSNVSLNNFHPTVKPTSLMQYLVRLVTPKGGTVLDVFMGSGSTGKATMYENIERDANYKFIGIELTKEYLPLCKARIEFVTKENIDLTEETIEENNDKNSNVPKIISLW